MKTTQLVTSLVAALALTLGVSADLKVTEPSADHWWIAKSINTLRWEGSDPAQFSVFLYNPDAQLLTSALALTSITNAYMVSLSVNPGEVRPGTGYVVQLTNPLNSSDIYTSSESFEIKAQGSTYPSQTTPGVGGSGSTVVVSATNTGPGTSASSAAASPSGAAVRGTTAGAGLFGLIAGAAAWAVAV